MGTTTTTNVHTTTSSFMSSTSTGPECDGHGECGDSQSGCVGCALNGPCFNELSKCQDTQECIEFAMCIDGCSDPGCADMCAAQFPEGASLYNDVLFCVICEQCPSDCDGPGSGCP